MKTLLLTALTALLAVGVASCSRPDAAFKDFNNIHLSEAELTIDRPHSSSANTVLTLDVKIADSIPSLQTGLMRVHRLPPKAGMVFPFDTPVGTGFYMKNTLIPLDIAFWGPDRRIVQIFHMLPCKRDPCRLYSPDQTYIGAVEMNLGLLAEHGVQIGDLVTLSG